MSRGSTHGLALGHGPLCGAFTPAGSGCAGPLPLPVGVLPSADEGHEQWVACAAARGEQRISVDFDSCVFSVVKSLCVARCEPLTSFPSSHSLSILLSRNLVTFAMLSCRIAAVTQPVGLQVGLGAYRGTVQTTVGGSRKCRIAGGRGPHLHSISLESESAPMEVFHGAEEE